MADGLSFKLDLDTTKFVAELDRAKLQAQSLGNSFANANKAAADSIGTMKSAYAQLIAAGKGSSDEALKLRDNIKAASAEADKLAKAATQVDKEFSKVGDGGALDGLIGKFKEGQKSASEGGGMFGSLAGKLGELASPAGLATAAVGALAAGFSFVVDVGKEFETSVASLSAVTGKSGEDLNNLADNARELAATFGGSAAEQMESFTGILSRIGPQLADSPAALKEFATNVNLLSKAGGIDATTAMDALTTSILQFNVDVNDSVLVAAKSTEAIDILAASAQVGASEIPQVAQALAVAGSAAAGANVSLLETNSAIQVLATKGKFGAEAGTSLRNVFLKLQDGGKEQANVLAQLGTSYEKLGNTLTSQGLSAALKEINSGLTTLGSDAARNKALSDLFGAENIVGAQALISNVEKLDQFSADIAKQTGGAAAQAATRMATLDEQLKRGKAAIDEVAISVYQKISPALSRATGAIFEFVQGISEKFGSIYNKIAPALEPLVQFIGGAVMVQFELWKNQVLTVYDVISNVFGRIGDAIRPLADRVSSLFGSFGSGESIMASITAVIKALWEVIGQELNVAVELAVTFFQTFVGVLTAAWDIAKGLLGAMGILGNETASAGKKTDDSRGFFEKLITTLHNVSGTIAGVVAVFKFFKETVGEVIEAVTKLDFSKVLDIFKKFGAGAGDAYNKGFNESQTKADNSKELSDKQEKNYLNLIHQVEDFGKRAGKLSKEQVETERAALRDKLTAQAEALKASNGITNDQIASVEKQLNAIKSRGTGDANDVISGKDKESKGKSAFQRATDEAKDLQKATDTALEKFKEDQQKVLLAEHRSELSNAEKRDLLEEQIRLQEIQAKKTEELFKKDGKINIKLDASKGESEADVNKTISDVQKKILPLKIQLQTSVDSAASKSFQTSINELADSLKDSATIDITAQFNQKEFVEDFLRKRASVEAQIDEIKIKLGAGQISEDDADKAISVLTKALDKADKDFQKTQAQATKAVTDARLAGMTDEVEKEKIIKIDKLIKERDAELSNVLITEEERKAIVIKYQKQIDDIRGVKKTSGLESLVNDFAKAFGDIFKIENDLSKKQSDDRKKEKGELQQQLTDLKKANQSKLLSYEDYADQRAAIEKKLADITAKEESKISTVTRTAAQAANKIIISEAEKSTAKQLDSLSKLEAGSDAAWTAIGTVMFNSTASLAAQGNNVWKSLATSMFNAARAGAASLSVLILGKELAEKSFLGIGTGAILTALLQIGLATAQSLLGFREGGYTGDRGVGDIAGVVHGKEFVHTADVTARNRPLFEHLHKGGDLSSWMVSPAGQLMNEQRHVSRLMATGQMSASISMSGVESRLDRVEKAVLKGNKKFESMQNVQMTVTHDPSLILKSQSRRLEVKQARY